MEFTITHLQNIQCLCYLNSWSPTLPIISFIIFRSSTKILNILDTPKKPRPSSNPFELNSSEFEFLSFDLGLLYFLGTSAFLRVRKNYPRAQILSLTLSIFFFSLICFLLKKIRIRGREEQAQSASCSPARPFVSPPGLCHFFSPLGRPPRPSRRPTDPTEP